MMMRMGIQREATESDAEYIARLTEYSVKLENEIRMWRNVFSCIQHIDNQMDEIYRMVNEGMQ